MSNGTKADREWTRIKNALITETERPQTFRYCDNLTSDLRVLCVPGRRSSQGASFSSSSSSSSSDPATRSDGVLEYWSTAPSPNCTRVAGKDAKNGGYGATCPPKSGVRRTTEEVCSVVNSPCHLRLASRFKPTSILVQRSG
jgi:hypothetical protein